MSEHDELEARDRRLLDELRATEDRAEPDWAALQARIGAALDREPSPRGRARRRWAAVGLAAVAAAAAVIALMMAPRRTASPTRVAPIDEAPLPDDDLVEALDVPDDLGGLSLDDELIDEAAALDDDPDDELEPLVPDGTWIDDLTDDELDWLEHNLETG